MLFQIKNENFWASMSSLCISEYMCNEFVSSTLSFQIRCGRMVARLLSSLSGMHESLDHQNLNSKLEMVYLFSKFETRNSKIETDFFRKFRNSKFEIFLKNFFIQIFLIWIHFNDFYLHVNTLWTKTDSFTFFTH